MSQYNKLSDIQYARFQILPVDLHLELFWSADIPSIFSQCLGYIFASNVHSRYFRNIVNDLPGGLSQGQMRA